MASRSRAWLLALCAVLIAAMSTPAAIAAEPDEPAGSERPGHAPDVLTLPGDTYFPESIAATPTGTIFVASITTGQIVRFRPGSTSAETFVPAGVNAGTAGIMVDTARGVLWACAVDLSFQTPTMLRAFDLSTGALAASYTVGDDGVAADIALARGDVYVTDTTNPTAATPRPGRILRLTTPDRRRPGNGTLTVWSSDPQFTDPGGLQINGIAFDGHRSFYTTNYSSGRLLRVGLRGDGSALGATEVDLGERLVNPDGIRMLSRSRLLVAENPGRLTLVDVVRRTRTVVGTFDQPTSVVRTGSDLWITEGQVLRLQAGEPPNLPFKVRRQPLR